MDTRFVDVSQLYAACFRHQESDAEDFNTMSIHSSEDGAKRFIEDYAREIGGCEDFTWFLDTTGTAWLYSVAPDADVDCHCFLVEKQTIKN